MVEIKDKNIIQKRFGKSFKSYNQQAVVQKEVAGRLAQQLSKLGSKHYSKLLEIGCGTGFLTKEMLERTKIDNYYLNDLTPEVFDEIKNLVPENSIKNFHFHPGDAEFMSFPEKLDAICSSSSIQWFNNLNTFFAKAHKLLNAKGIIAFSTYGEMNFKEIKTVLNIGLEYKTLPEILEIMNSDFEILHAEDWTQQLQFISPMEILKHMKLTGVNGLKKSFWGKEKFLSFNDAYMRFCSNTDNTVNLTYHPIIIIARKK